MTTVSADSLKALAKKVEQEVIAESFALSLLQRVRERYQVPDDSAYLDITTFNSYNPDKYKDLEHYYEAIRSSALAGFDSLWKKAADRVAIEVVMEFDPWLFDYVQRTFDKKGLKLSTVVLSAGACEHFMRGEFLEEFILSSSPLDVLSGIVGSYRNIPVRTDAYRHPGAKVLTNEMYFIAKGSGFIYQEDFDTCANGYLSQIETKLSVNPNHVLVYRI
jgi:hypothetical protein